MKYAIISDIHGNLQAFEKFLSIIDTFKVDKIISLGDNLGYGANPNEIYDLIKKNNIQTIIGNHEYALLNEEELMSFNNNALSSAMWTKKTLKEEHFRFIEKLNFTITYEDLVFTHGSMAHPELFKYTNSIFNAWQNFRFTDKRITFVGHTHVPEYYIYDNKKDWVIPYKYVFNKKLYLNKDKRYLFNVGSLGQPRDNNNAAAFCIYDSIENSIILYRITYDYEKAKDTILKNKLPKKLGERLILGI